QEMRAFEQREKESATAREAYNHIRGPQADAAESSERNELVDYFAGRSGRVLDLDFRGVAAEKKAIRAGASGKELRTIIQEDSATLGGDLLPTSFLRKLYDYIEWYTGVLNLNVTVLTTGSGESL